MNLPLLSAREALRRFPHQLRFFIFALMLIAFVAPTWHVCMLGGQHAEHTGKSHHGWAAQVAALKSAAGERQALICYCAPRAHAAKYPDFKGAELTSLPKHDHPNCLALLLQGMPAVLAFSPEFSVTETPVKIAYIPATYSLNSRFFALYNGRAPPVFL